ncbi:hypothetical protein PYK22_00745 [Pyrinomonas methylaliphatogenes]|uniref:Uncharacterized protein n=1 Tax=Pyrinomonas methylaliphatogenes TaxID=454194 RepID=A0A0B6WX63_9BACT|nr:hypothetical protein PYK22_00745 [Pyrinomonas methylaliphatogenes]
MSNHHQASLWIRTSVGCLLLLLCHSLFASSLAQQRGPSGPPTLGLEQGFIEFETPDFRLKLVRASQTVAALQPKGAGDFDFTPADRLTLRARDGFYHLGDLIFRVRVEGQSSWQDYSTAAARKPVRQLPVSGPALAAADLEPTLPPDSPLQITRTWALDGGRLVLRFAIRNRRDVPVEIGALGIPLVFNNILTNRTLEQAHEVCSFSDPYIGRDGGYLQVTRLNGRGPALIVVPDGRTPFEAYMPLSEPMRPSQTFEGMFAWMVHSRAYAENEWRSAEPWNPPTSRTLAPGETVSYGLRFLLADEIRSIENSLIAHGRPVAVGVPGYILPMDLEGRLFLRYAGHKVKRVRVEPQGAIAIAEERPRNGWLAYSLRGKTWGRARLTISYDDGLEQSVHYYVIKPAAQAVADLGRFLMTRQWFDDPNDPFRRSPSVMSYDREANKIIAQESRVWIAGLSDEGGAGSWLAAAMKQLAQPDEEEIRKYERFIDQVLWGGIQYKDGPNKYGVRKSLFFYAPQEMAGFKYDPSFNWSTWTSWKRAEAESIGRAYNYPHVVAAYWAFYRLARNQRGLVTNHPWEWYLEQAYQTARFLTERDARGRYRVGYVDKGLMEGTIFVLLLEDLKREGWNEKARDLETRMKERADRWRQEAYPFGSEMAWDSTGQEEVYAWCKYFGYDDKAEIALASIIGYMPTIPHWGYNGNARRYWDFLYAGKLRRIERQLHHYGSGLNAIPVLAHYREHPDDYYLLRIGYGGALGALSNIDQEGFASAAFHSYPTTLRWDAYSGDYGPNFFGHVINAATYIVNHPELGWLSFGGNLKLSGDWVTVEPRDSMRQRIYIAPLGLWLTLDAGSFESVAINVRTRAVRIRLSGATRYVSRALLRVEQPAKVQGVGAYRARQRFASERGAYAIPLGPSVTQVELVEGR